MLVNGVNLNVKISGSGPGVVALHGFAGNLSTWDQFIRAARKEYKVVAVDLLGHGDSDSPIASERYRIERSIIDISTILKRLKVTRPCWLGYSMGGRIGLAAAALSTEQCGCLVLEGASPGLTSSRERADRRRRDGKIAQLIMRKGMKAFVDYWEAKRLFETQKSLSRSMRRRIRNQRLRSGKVGLANTLRAANPGVQLPMQRFLPSINVPVLCVVGEYDRKFKDIGRRMCRQLPAGRLAVIPGAGHAPHLEKPQAFNRTVLSFLREVRW